MEERLLIVVICYVRDVLQSATIAHRQGKRDRSSIILVTKV